MGACTPQTAAGWGSMDEGEGADGSGEQADELAVPGVPALSTAATVSARPRSVTSGEASKVRGSAVLAVQPQYSWLHLPPAQAPSLQSRLMPLTA